MGAPLETCVRKIHFCYGHRVMNHESKCATLHGHNGVFWIHAAAVKGLDQLGRVIDFSVLKEKIGTWVDKNWDHTMILFQEDKKTLELVEKAPSYKKPFVMPSNPTAENLASYLLWEVCPKELEGLGVVVFKVTLFETENCYAEHIVDIDDPELLKRYKLN